MDTVSYELTFSNNQINNIIDKYYNLNSSLNHLLNDFLYYQYSNVMEEDWIFLLKDSSEFEHPPLAGSFVLEDIMRLNTIIKNLRQILKTQIQCGNSLLNQSRKYSLLKISNEIRINSDSRYTIGSLRTTNRTHKQRMTNLDLYYNSIPYIYKSIDDIFSSLLCLITIESKSSSSKVPETCQQNSENDCIDILNLAWEITTPYVTKLLSDESDKKLSMGYVQNIPRRAWTHVNRLDKAIGQRDMVKARGLVKKFEDSLEKDSIRLQPQIGKGLNAKKKYYFLV